MRQMLKLFIKIIKYQFLAEIEYPGAYIAGIIGQWVAYGAQMLMLFIMVWNFGSLAGWLPAEVVFLFAIWLMTYALAATFVFNITRSFDQLVINGTMDEALVRPMPAFIYLLATHVNVGYISHITLTSVALGISISQLGVTWTIWQWLWFIVMLLSGAVITACFMVIVNLPAMRTRSRSPFAPLFWETREFTQYPITIYPKVLQFVFTAILPLAFINFYPSQVLLNRQEGLGAPFAIWLSPLIAVLMVGITAFCWKKMSKFYESAGT